jgi:nucleoside-diphosphate-sugar epimerase
VLVTGAGGFLGRRLVARLRTGHDVVAVARRPLDGVETVVCDLAGDTAGLPGRVDAVVHLAQSARYREWPDGADDVFAVNVGATHRLLEHARRAGASHFVLASTGAVYAPADGPLREDGALAPRGFYPRSKLAAEVLARAYESEFVTAVLRPFAIYGPGQQGMMVASIAARVAAGEEVTVQGDPGLRMNPIHVDDAARAFAAALELGESGAFNVAGEEVVSLSALVELLAELADVTPRITHVEAPSASLVGDTSRMRSVLGVVPRVGLREGLAEVLRPPAGRAR